MNEPQGTKISALGEFDAAEHLDSPEDVAAYLTAVLEEGDAALFAAALGDIARARGMTTIAEGTGLSREGLYKALRAKDHSAPRLDTVTRVLRALGLRLVAKPEERPIMPGHQ